MLYVCPGGTVAVRFIHVVLKELGAVCVATATPPTVRVYVELGDVPELTDTTMVLPVLFV